MLFDKHTKPVLSGLNEDYDWDAVEAYEDYVYSTADDDESVSDEQFDELVQEVRDLYDEYYRLHES